MPDNAILPNRREELGRQVQAIAATLESQDEVRFAIELLQQRGKRLRSVTNAAFETLARQFLQERYRLFGELPEPSVEFVRPLLVWMRRDGFDFTVHKPWTKRWEAEISRARFVKLGRRALARYVVLKIPAKEIVPAGELAEYDFKADELVEVYVSMRALINARPQWVIDVPTRVRIARARAIAEQSQQQEGETR